MNTYTVDLGKEYHYFLPENLGEIPVFRYPNYLPGYTLCEHFLSLERPHVRLYNIRKFLYNGLEQELPGGLEKVFSILVCRAKGEHGGQVTPEGTRSHAMDENIIVRINMDIEMYDVREPIVVYFAKNGRNWNIYQSIENVKYKELERTLDLLNKSPDPTRENIPNCKLYKVNLELFHAQIRRNVYPKMVLWSRFVSLVHGRRVKNAKHEGASEL